MFEGQSLFHESYYEHACTVFSEKDVLYTEVRGTAAALRRWWLNLFMLSYSDPRCYIFYPSSQAMRIDRSKHLRNHRGRIHPLSQFSNVWGYIISLAVITNTVVFRYITSITFVQIPLTVYYVTVFIDFLCLFDIYINFKTGYLDSQARTTVLDASKGILRYSSTKLGLHCMSAIPLTTIMMMRYGLQSNCIICKANKFICTIRLLSLLDTYRIFDSTQHWVKEGCSFGVTYFFKFLRILLVSLAMMMQFLTLANTSILLIMLCENEIHEQSYFVFLLQLKYWHGDVLGTDFRIFCIECSKVVKSIFGGGLMPKIHYLDMMFAMIGFVLSNLLILWALIEGYAVFYRKIFSNNTMKITKERTLSMLTCKQLSDRISDKVSDYYNFNMSRMVVVEKGNDLYQFLPSSIKKEIKLTSYSKHVISIPYFSEWPAAMIEDIVMLLQENEYLPLDVVVDSWTQGDGLIIIDTGVLAVYTPDQKEVGHLIDGDCFGELSLVTDKEIRTSYVVATSWCKTLMLEKNSFRRYMRQHPEQFFAMRDQLRNKYATKDRFNGFEDQEFSQESLVSDSFADAEPNGRTNMEN